MLNSRLATQQKQMAFELIEVSNPIFLETMRSKARMLARKRPDRQITIDDVREYYDQNIQTLCIKPTSANVWGVLFQKNEWKHIGYTRSRQVQGHKNLIGIWELK